MSGTSLTVWDFFGFPTVPDFADYWKLENIDIPVCLGWTGTNLENQERFYFPNASQISAIVGDHSRQMKTEICTLSNGFHLLPIPWISGLQSPYHKKTWHLSKIWDRPLVIIQYISKIWYGEQKSKIPNHLGFYQHMKTRLKIGIPSYCHMVLKISWKSSPKIKVINSIVYLPTLTP